MKMKERNLSTSSITSPKKTPKLCKNSAVKASKIEENFDTTIVQTNLTSSTPLNAPSKVLKNQNTPKSENNKLKKSCLKNISPINSSSKNNLEKPVNETKEGNDSVIDTPSKGKKRKASDVDENNASFGSSISKKEKLNWIQRSIPILKSQTLDDQLNKTEIATSLSASKVNKKKLNKTAGDVSLDNDTSLNKLVKTKKKDLLNKTADLALLDCNSSVNKKDKLNGTTDDANSSKKHNELLNKTKLSESLNFKSPSKKKKSSKLLVHNESPENSLNDIDISEKTNLGNKSLNSKKKKKTVELDNKKPEKILNENEDNEKLDKFSNVHSIKTNSLVVDDEDPNIDKTDIFKKKKPKAKTIRTKDDYKRLVHVSNFQIKTRKIHLKRFFSSCGPVESIWFRETTQGRPNGNKKEEHIKIKTDPSKTPRIAFVMFKNEDSVEKAVLLNGTIFKEHQLKIEKSYRNNYSVKNGIFLGNLPRRIKEEKLHSFFSKCGTIIHTKVFQERKWGSFKDCGLITFKEPSGVDAALNLDGMLIRGIPVRVSVYTDDKNKQNKYELEKHKHVKMNPGEIAEKKKMKKQKGNATAENDNFIKFNKPPMNKIGTNIIPAGTSHSVRDSKKFEDIADVKPTRIVFD